MKNFLLTFTLLCFSSVVFAQAPADAVLGQYMSPSKKGKIEIYKSGSTYNGKIVWLDKPERKDKDNPDPKLRDRSIMNMNVLTGFTYNAKSKEWVDGEIYDPENGKTYSCKMWMEGENLKVRGYIGVSLLGRTEIFTRAK